MGTLLVMYVLSGVLLIAVSIPMVMRKIPPNDWYGFRVRKTLENPAVWYPANEYAGRRLVWVGFVCMVTAIGLYCVPNLSLATYATLCLTIVGVCLAFSIVQCFLFLRTL